MSKVNSDLAFLQDLNSNEQSIIAKLRGIILSVDKTVSEKVGDIMSQKNAFVYQQEGVFKYGIAKAKNHISFHSMVMYAFPEIAEKYSSKFKGVKFQKGCINIKKLENLDVTLFEEMVRESSQKDFSGVIKHYKNKK